MKREPVFRPVFVTVLLACSLILFCSAQGYGQDTQINYNTYYRYPFSVGLQYQSLTPFADYGSNFNIFDLSALLRWPFLKTPVLVPSAESRSQLWMNLELWAWIPELASRWNVSIGVSVNEHGQLSVNWGWHDLATGRHRGGSFPGRLDTWYDLRVDVRRRSTTTLRIDFYVDDLLVFSGVPTESGHLLDPASHRRQRVMGSAGGWGAERGGPGASFWVFMDSFYLYPKWTIESNRSG